MNILEPETERPTPTLQSLQDCNAYLCQIATVWNYRNATVLCQNATDVCRIVDPVHSIEESNSKVSNGTGSSPLFFRRNDDVL